MKKILVLENNRKYINALDHLFSHFDVDLNLVQTRCEFRMAIEVQSYDAIFLDPDILSSTDPMYIKYLGFIKTKMVVFMSERDPWDIFEAHQNYELNHYLEKPFALKDVYEMLHTSDSIQLTQNIRMDFMKDNIQKIISVCDKFDKPVALKLVQSMKDEIQTKIPQMKNYSEHNDFESIGGLAHQLKSNFKLFKLEQLASKCEDLEEKIEKNEYNDLNSLVTVIKSLSSDAHDDFTEVESQLLKAA